MSQLASALLPTTSQATHLTDATDRYLDQNVSLAVYAKQKKSLVSENHVPT